MEDQYLFDHQFQTKILAICLKEFKVVSSYRSIFNPHYFENPVHQNLCKILLDYHDHYRLNPTLDVLKNQIQQAPFIPNEVVKSQHIEELHNVWKLEVPDQDYIKDKAIEFAKHQAIKVAILKSVDHLQKGDYLTISKEIETAQKVGENVLNIGRMYIEDHELPLRQVDPLKSSSDYIKTMWKSLDQSLRGGLYKGQLGVLMGPAKSGKSTVLMNLGAAAVQTGKKVFHYTLELNTQFLVERYDSRITGIPMDQLTTQDEAIKSKLATIKSRQGEVIIKEYPTKSVTIRNIRSHIHHVHSLKGYYPDLIIVDYGDLLRSSEKFEDSYREMGAVFEQLRALAMEMDVPIWTATQANRAAFQKSIVNLDDVSTSLEKIMVADIIISICQTADEKKKDELRLFIAGGRTCQDGVSIPCKVDWKRMIIRES